MNMDIITSVSATKKIVVSAGVVQSMPQSLKILEKLPNLPQLYADAFKKEPKLKEVSWRSVTD